LSVKLLCLLSLLSPSFSIPSPFLRLDRSSRPGHDYLNDFWPQQFTNPSFSFFFVVSGCNVFAVFFSLRPISLSSRSSPTYCFLAESHRLFPSGLWATFPFLPHTLICHEFSVFRGGVATDSRLPANSAQVPCSLSQNALPHPLPPLAD